MASLIYDIIMQSWLLVQKFKPNSLKQAHDCTDYKNKIALLNPLKTTPEYTRAGLYGKCVL